MGVGIHNYNPANFAGDSCLWTISPAEGHRLHTMQPSGVGTALQTSSQRL